MDQNIINLAFAAAIALILLLICLMDKRLSKPAKKRK